VQCTSFQSIKFFGTRFRPSTRATYIHVQPTLALLDCSQALAPFVCHVRYTVGRVIEVLRLNTHCCDAVRDCTAHDNLLVVQASQPAEWRREERKELTHEWGKATKSEGRDARAPHNPHLPHVKQRE